MNDNVMNDNVRLHEFCKVEWFDVCKKIKPDLTPEEYELAWDEFQKHKENGVMQ